MSATAWNSYGETKRSVARGALNEGVAATARRFERSAGFVTYHREKLLDPTFHNGSWGGARNLKFKHSEQLFYEVCLPASTCRSSALTLAPDVSC